jgi:hypothetical protein
MGKIKGALILHYPDVTQQGQTEQIDIEIEML